MPTDMLATADSQNRVHQMLVQIDEGIIHLGMRYGKKSERTILSGRDSLLVLSLLDNPPAPTPKLQVAIAAMPRQRRKRDEPV
jgi:hypothetical protein